MTAFFTTGFASSSSGNAESIGKSGSHRKSAVSKPTETIDEGTAAPVDVATLLPGDSLADLQKKYPQYSRSDIITRQTTLTRSKMISEKSLGDDSSAGGYFDYENNVCWVYATDSSGLDRQRARAQDAGISARGGLVKYSYKQLAAAYSAASALATTASNFDLTYDFEHNAVVVKLLPRDFEKLAGELRDIGPVLVEEVEEVEEPWQGVPADGACPSRSSCGSNFGRTVSYRWVDSTTGPTNTVRTEYQ